jgi:hypothetical protein
LGDPVCRIRLSYDTGKRRIFRPKKKEEAVAWKNGITRSLVDSNFYLISSGELNHGRWSDKDMGHALEKVRNVLKFLGGNFKKGNLYRLILTTVIEWIFEKKKCVLNELK